MPNAFALVDCNNFYVSCERVFNPKLLRRPVVVLSNNDGCIISRSDEAKAIGVKMGAPLFEMRELIEAHNIEVLSSNYALYGDMSGRVAKTLQKWSPEVEIYSVDEAFLRLSYALVGDLSESGKEIGQTLKRWTGIPVSIGIAPTKTLTKIAVHIAKRSAKAHGVVNLVGSPHVERALRRVPVEDVWGIGRKHSRRLTEKGIYTALDLRSAEMRWVKKELGVAGARIVYELRGVSCLPLEACPRPKKAITSSRSFGRPVESLAEIREAIACHVAKAAEKLRHERLTARVLIVFLATHRFKTDSFFSNSTVVNLPVSTDLTPELIGYAQRAVEYVCRADCRFKKAGVILTDLAPVAPVQTGLFDNVSREKVRRVLQVMDEINASMGQDTLRFAATGLRRAWEMRCDRRSPRYTTRWDELLTLAA